MKKLDKTVREKVYETLGFNFVGDKDSLNSNNLFEAIILGETFESFCEWFELDFSTVEFCIKRYVIHQIYQETSTFTIEEKQMMEVFSEEELLNTTFGDILEEAHFTTPKENLDYFSQEIRFLYSPKIQSHEKISKRIYKSLDYCGSNENEFYETWGKFSKRSGSFFRLYLDSVKCRPNNNPAPINTQPSKIVKIDYFLKSIVEHSHQFIKILSEFDDDYNLSEDILEFERNTNILFLLKVSSLLKQSEYYQSIDENAKDHFFKILSSFIFIDDIQLKLYFTKQFIKIGDFFPFTEGIIGFNKLFWLLFIYLPFLKDFISDKLLENIPNKVLKLTSEEAGQINLKRTVSDIKRLKKKLFLYQLTKDTACYDIEELSKQINDINDVQLDNTDFFNLYSKVFKMKEIRLELQESIESFILKDMNRHKEEYLKSPYDSIEEILFRISKFFKTEGKLLAFRLESEHEITLIKDEFEKVFKRLDHLDFDIGLEEILNKTSKEIK